MKNYVAERRTDAGLTQGDLASMVGTSRQTVISIEKGRYDPGIKVAIKLARALGTTVEALFNLDATEQ